MLWLLTSARKKIVASSLQTSRVATSASSSFSWKSRENLCRLRLPFGFEHCTNFYLSSFEIKRSRIAGQTAV